MEVSWGTHPYYYGYTMLYMSTYNWNCRIVTGVQGNFTGPWVVLGNEIEPSWIYQHFSLLFGPSPCHIPGVVGKVRISLPKYHVYGLNHIESAFFQSFPVKSSVLEHKNIFKPKMRLSEHRVPHSIHWWIIIFIHFPYSRDHNLGGKYDIFRRTTSCIVGQILTTIAILSYTYIP